nr:MAG TPA: hypothetical protein [Caudoviricetes sp.]
MSLGCVSIRGFFYPHIPLKHAIEHIIVLKYWHRANFLAFFLCRLVFSSYLCQRLQDDSVSILQGDSLRLWLHCRRLFLCLLNSSFLVVELWFSHDTWRLHEP